MTKITFANIFKGDKIFWNALLMLGIISVLAVYSSSSGLAYQEKDCDTEFYLKKQIVFVGLAFFVMIVLQFISFKNYKKYSKIIFFVSLLLIVITLFAGVEINGARRWLSIPVVHIMFQPSDLAKLALIILASSFLSRKSKDEKQEKDNLIKTALYTIAIVVITLKSDFSTAFLMFFAVLIILFVSGIKIRYLLMTVAVIIIAGGIFIGIVLQSDTNSRFATWKNRIENFVDPKSGDNYQVTRANIAVATGGLVGRGPGNSVQRNILSQSNSDFIFAFIIEEYGLIGAIVIIALYLWILFRGINIAKNCKEKFPMLLTLGLILNITIQAFMNMMVAVNLVPVTGQTLPFVSMGGTSMIITAISFGIILNISYTNRMEAKKEEAINGIKNEL